MKIDEATVNAVVDEGERVVVYDDLATDVVYDLLDYSETPDQAAKFLELFELVKPRGYWMANPNEDFYQGIAVMALIRRKSDGRLFGYEYWTPISKHGEPFVESNGDKHGFDYDIPAGFDWDNDYLPNPYVFLPVAPFTIIGYATVPADAASVDVLPEKTGQVS